MCQRGLVMRSNVWLCWLIYYQNLDQLLVCVFVAGVSCRLRKVRCYRQSFSPAISCWSSNRRTNVSVCQCVLSGCVLYLHTSHCICISCLIFGKSNCCKCVCVCVSGCLLTIILLMRALDPLGHEKETLAHFQTLKVRKYYHNLNNKRCSGSRK